ncbi:MAG: TonB-dependent receptor [Gemmatimonadota bacterium]
MRTISLDSLLNTRISTASKYAQTSAEAPASVTIITADELARGGYGSLQEVLETVRGFYTSNDLNYVSLGVRGFGRPSDYNNRVLVLIDGHSLNDQTWGGAPLGGDLPLNLDAVERLEIVRGPGSALYGTSAMFAVINIVTKSGVALDGTTVSVRGGTGRLREARMVTGRAITPAVSYAASGVISRLDGNDLYFAEYDSPATNHGIAHALDWERAVSGLAAVTVKDVVVRIGYQNRGRGIPTGSFGTAFNDPRSEAVDENLWGDIIATRDFAGVFHLSARLYGDRYRYRGVYPADAGPAYSDGGGSSAVGTEVIGTWEHSSRNKLTLGVETRLVSRADYYELFADQTSARDDQPSNVYSVYAQDEFQLSSRLILVGGLRADRNSRHGGALTPRVAIIAAPRHGTTIKALYGEAFRAPSAAEADITTSFYTRNPSLSAERIRTFELTAEQRLGAPWLLGGSLYRYQIHGLIDQVELDQQGLVYQNLNEAEAAGLELEMDYKPASAVSGHASYAIQTTDDAASDERLTNSPQHIALASVSGRTDFGVQATLSGRYESGRKTLSGPSTKAFLRSDANISYTPVTLNQLEVGIRAVNLFDTYYATPGGLEHRQMAIAQAGRTVSVRLSWRF